MEENLIDLGHCFRGLYWKEKTESKNKTMQTFSSHSEAIKFALKQQEVKNIDICKKLNINPGNLSSFLNNKRTIPHCKIEAIMRELNIRLLA